MKRTSRLTRGGLLLGLLLILFGLQPASRPSRAVARTGVDPAAAAPLVTGSIGGYPEQVNQVALAVEAGGRVHALWTGKLNPNFDDYVYYSSSADGVNWTPYQILDHWYGSHPALAVDDVGHRVHLVYSSRYDGIVHRVAADGVLGDPVTVVPRREYFLPGFPLPSGGLGWLDIAVAEDSAYAHLVWQEGFYQRIGGDAYPYRHRAWYAYWDGTGWSAPQQKINDLDTAHVSIASTPDGRMMMAWFQRWQQSLGDAVSPGDPIVPRTAYGDEPGRFPLRQAAHALYPQPERDESILLAYSGGDDAFVLATDHFMWPGHSRVYRYLWQDGAWSEPLSVAENTTGWAFPVYVGVAEDAPLIRYVYSQDGLKMRTETDGALGTPQPISDYLAARGYAGSALAFATDAAGDLHLVLTGAKDGVAGFYYVAP